jgi:selenocysteine lyase/cysteine desulfurase
MDPVRRRLLTALTAAATTPAAAAAAPAPSRDFAIPPGVTYLNSAYIHPMPAASAENLQRYIAARSQPDGPTTWDRLDIKAEFAALINAKPSEIAYIPNTSTGENIVVKGLGIPQSCGNVVTDAFHFEGALIHLQELQKHQGLDLRIVPPRGNRIELDDLAKVIDRNTQLVEISHVAMFTGFQHDLKAVCDLAHANGALVYADIAQSVGCTPIDVKASGVDFCACSSFKWLMGDFGLGFLYVREDLIDRVIRRSHYGYFQARTMDTHFLPYDEPGASPFTYEFHGNAAGRFESGSNANPAIAVLSKSLPYLRQLTPAKIEAQRQPLLQRLHQEMPRLGFEPMTPPESRSALISFAVKDSQPVAERLKKAKINVRVAPHFLRLSPSVFNTTADIDRFLGTIA